MPRSARIVVANYPHHVLHRGHNREPLFSADGDRIFYLANLAEWKSALGCRVFAYCLMGNHVHLVIDPGADSSNLARLMKRVAGRQTRYVNRLAKRTGTLWDGRYKSSLIRVDEYLLACCRYVELNPVRAGMVADPGQYRWSSYRHKIGLSAVDWLDPDPFYLSLGSDPREREAAYRVLVESALARGLMDREWDTIREAVQRGQLTGGESFVDEIQDKTGRRIESRGPGRPSDKYRPE